MASLNKVLLIGNLGQDPEIRTLPSGGKVANISIATTESYKNKEGQKVETTEWHRLELWEGLALIAEQYLKKGDSIYAEGKIKTEKYTDANGQEKYSMKIRVNTMQMLGKPNRDQSQSTNAVSEKPMMEPAIVEEGDGLPF